MSRQYTRNRAATGQASPPVRKASGKTTVLAADDHQARAWETATEKEARFAIGAAKKAERSERATASAAPSVILERSLRACWPLVTLERFLAQAPRRAKLLALKNYMSRKILLKVSHFMALAFLQVAF